MQRFASIVAITLVALALAMPAHALNEPTPLTDDVVMNTQTEDKQFYPAIAKRPDGKLVAVWESTNQDGSGDGVYMQLYNADRTKYGGEVRVNTHTANDQKSAKVAVATDNSFVVVWTSDAQDGDDFGIYSQRYDSSANKIGGEFRVNIETQNIQGFPGVAFLANGDVVYVWHSYHTRRIILRRFSSSFAPIGGEVTVDDTTGTITQTDPMVAALTGGGCVVVWAAMRSCCPVEGEEAFAQIFAGDGSKVGQPFFMNQHTDNFQANAHAAGRPDGTFIATWKSSGQDGTHSGVYARHYSATGTALSDEFLVNTVTAGDQIHPAVAAFGDNSFAIVWQGTIIGSGNQNDVGLQYFDASLNKVGAHQRVNIHTSSHQFQSDIAASFTDGIFAVAWASYQQVATGSFYDVVVRWYSVDIVSPPAVPLECTSACLRYFCKEGSLIDVKVKGGVTNDVWGSAYFTDDSNVATAAVFAGLVAAGETATVTVKCSGPKSSFTSGSANGVTTQAFASSWPSSFTFDLGGETQPPQPPAPERCFAEPCAVGRCVVQGTSFNLVVRGSVTSNIWGSLSFSDDSSVGTAAVHQGVLQAGATGSVTVSCVGPRASLSGTTRNGVTSNDFGPWQYTYTLSPGPTAPPTADEHTCTGACLEGKCPENDVFFLRVAGTTYGYLWGSAPYSDDTTVAAAAVHAGLVSAGSVAIVKATCTGAQSSFTASTQNAVTTSSYGPWSASFTLSAGTDMPTLTCGPGWPCLISLCKVTGHVFKVSVTGSAAVGSQIWGTVHYTDDSPVSHAAVHSGLVADGETKVLYATCEGGQPSFTGTTAFGVTSESWTAWPASYTLSATQ